MSITIPGTGKHRAPKHDVTGWPRLRRDKDETSVVDELLKHPEQDITAPVPTFTPRELAATGAQPVLAEPVTEQHEAPAEERDFLERVAEGLRDLDFSALDQAKAVPGLTYADVIAHRTAGYPEGVARGILIGALWEAHEWYADLDGSACEKGCKADGWLCEDHLAYLVLAKTYEELHDFACEAVLDSTVVAHVAEAIRGGRADLGDLGSPKSKAVVILGQALAGDGAR